MTPEEIGPHVGFSEESAREAVRRPPNVQADYDPRLSTLPAFAEALNRPLKDLP
jgi:hypothetical protein